MKYIQMKKMIIACVICILHAYGSDNLKGTESAYNAAIQEMFDVVNQMQVAPEEVAGWIVDDHHDEGVEKDELLRRYNILREPQEYLNAIDFVSKTMLEGAYFDSAIDEALERYKQLKKEYLQDLHIATRGKDDKLDAIKKFLARKNQQAAPRANPQYQAPAAVPHRYYPQHAPAPRALKYGWEGNRDLNAFQKRPEKKITVIDNGNFNIYNVASLGHCGLYAINATRQDVINAANGNDLPIVQKLRAEPGTPLTNGQLVKIGVLLHKNVVIFYNNEKVTSDFDENTEEFYEFSEKNPDWPTYYVFTEGTGHFKVAAPVDDDLLNKYGAWKQAHVRESEDIEEGNVDYDALDESQTLR
ncbi:MAG: hypothetical protein CNLJKLNK_00024 [Holosporales bacterium]